MTSTELLLEMGFPKIKVEEALKATNNSGIEAAMEWLFANQEASTVEPPSINEPCSSTLDVESLDIPSEEGKLAQPTLTEEEKKEQIKKLEEKMKQRRIEKEEQDKKDAIEREKQRIQSGKQLAEAKKKLHDEEMKKLADERKREKMEAKAARDKVLRQIEEDKKVRKLNSQPFSAEQKPQTVSVEPSKSVKQYGTSKIQIRLMNGSTLTQTFQAKEQLSAVRLFAEMNRPDEEGTFNLMTSFPRKIFTDDEYDATLEALGLVPSAVLIVTKAIS